MSHTHNMMDTDPHFYIDVESRTIESLSEEPVVLVKGDHNSEIFTFEMDRKIDDHDVTLCNKVTIHYINIGSGSSNRKADIYTVTDLKIDPEDNDTVLFTWKIPITATTYAGALSFIVRFECTSGTEITYAWNTVPCNEVTVLDSIYNIDQIEEQYADVIGEWYNEILNAQKQALDEIGKSGGVVVSKTEPTGDNIDVWIDDSNGETLRLLEERDFVKMANAIKSTVNEVDVVRLDDVSPLQHSIKVKVKCKNLFDQTKLLNVNTYQKFNIKVEPGKTYTASSNIPKNSAAEVYFNGDYTVENGVWEGQSKTFIATVDEMYIAFQDRGNVQGIIDGDYYIQLEEGEVATEYEPFVDPASTLITRCGKNVFKITKKSQTLNGLTFTVNEDGTVTVDGTAEKTSFFALGNIQPKIGKKYRLSGSPSGSSFDTYLLYIHNNTSGVDIYDVGQGKTFVGAEGDQGLVIAVYSGTTVNNLKFYPMVVSGQTSGEYEQYIAETYTTNSDGIVEINSLSPTMTIFTDKTGLNLEFEYNQDTNIALNNMKEDIKELDRVTSEIINNGGGGSTPEGYSYSKSESDNKYAAKANTLAGYGITDAYTKTEVDDKISGIVAGDVTSITIDQSYNPESENAQSGKAVEEGISQVYDLIATEKQGVNLLNPETWTSGYMNIAGQLKTASTLSHTSIPIDVEEGDVIRAYTWNGSGYGNPHNIRYVTAYVNGVTDSTLGQDGNAKSYVVPAGVTSIIVSAVSNTALITKNMENPPTEKVDYIEPYKVPSEVFFREYELTKENLNMLLSRMTKVTKQYRNMFNPETAVIGRLDSDGVVDSSNTTFVTSDYIPISGGQRIRSRVYGAYNYAGGLNNVCFYDADRNLIDDQSLAMSEIMRCTQVNCAYVRVSIASYYKDIFNLYIGDVVLDKLEYIPYGTYDEYVAEVKNKKKLVVDGDSITFGVKPTGFGDGYNKQIGGLSYIDHVAHDLDCDLINYAVSASTLALPPDGGSFTVEPLLTRYTKLPDDADMVYIAIGSNDWSSPSIPLGVFNSEDENTFYGALHSLCRKLKIKYPNTQVMFATPIKRGDKTTELDIQKGQPNAAGEYMVDYRNAIIEVCEYYGYPVCDMYAKSGVNAWLSGDVTNMIPDKIHPNEKGHRLMAQVCTNALLGYV